MDWLDLLAVQGTLNEARRGSQGASRAAPGKSGLHARGEGQTFLSSASCISGSTGAEHDSPVFLGFPGGSDGKESACSAGDLGLIPGSGRSPGEGKGDPLQYSWASLVTQLVKNLPAMGGTWVQSLGWEDPMEKGKATHSSILAWRIL